LGVIWSRMEQPDKAEEAFQRAHRHLRLLVEESPKDPRFRSEWIEILGHLGYSALVGSSAGYARGYYCKAAELSQQLVDDYPNDSRYRADRWRCQNSLDSTLGRMGRNHEREELLRGVLKSFEQLPPGTADRSEWQLSLAETLSNLGDLYRFTSRPRDAEQAID